MKLHRIFLALSLNGLWFGLATAQDAEAYLRGPGEVRVFELPSWLPLLVVGIAVIGFINSIGRRAALHMILIIVSFYGGYAALEILTETPSILSMIGGGVLSWITANVSSNVLKPDSGTKEHKNEIRRAEAAKIRANKLELLD